MRRENKEYYKYLDETLIQSKFRIDLIASGRSILNNKFPELKSSKRKSADLVINYIVDTDPYNRLNSNISLFQ